LKRIRNGALALPAVASRAARWFLFRPEIPIWVYFGGTWNGKCCYVYILVFSNSLLTLVIFCGHFVIFIVIWYIFPRFGILCPEKSGTPGRKPSPLAEIHKSKTMKKLFTRIECEANIKEYDITGIRFMAAGLSHLDGRQCDQIRP
jgi:hypothetical protein